jgi:hypothetical protein
MTDKPIDKYYKSSITNIIPNIIPTIKDMEYYNELPDSDSEDPVIKMWQINNKIWVQTESGKKYIVPHHSEGKPIRADLRLVE